MPNISDADGFGKYLGVLKENLQYIEDDTFSACKSIDSVVLPDDLTAIGKRAFQRCKKLKKLDLPKSVNSLGEHAFAESGIKMLIVRNPRLNLKESRCLTGCKGYTIYAPKNSLAGNYIPDRTLPLNALKAKPEEQEALLVKKASEGALAGLTFVVTGDVACMPDRKDLKRFIERAGGRLTSSVSGNTNYLIANNPKSGTSKLAMARQLGVQIIDEKTFLKMAGLAQETD